MVSQDALLRELQAAPQRAELLRKASLEQPEREAVLLEEACNYPRGLLNGKTILKFISRTDYRDYRAKLVRLKEGRCVDNWRLTIQPRERPPFSAAVRVGPMTDRTGKLAGLRWQIRAER